ncbi:MAG: hypothetical protein AB4042_19620 [Leptolyngbyaceae cyanobacterium]
MLVYLLSEYAVVYFSDRYGKLFTSVGEWRGAIAFDEGMEMGRSRWGGEGDRI